LPPEYQLVDTPENNLNQHLIRIVCRANHIVMVAGWIFLDDTQIVDIQYNGIYSQKDYPVLDPRPQDVVPRVPGLLPDELVCI